MKANKGQHRVLPTDSFLQRLPKTDLHVHLDGSLRLETIIDLAHDNGVKLPANEPDRLAKAIHMGEVCEDLNDYLTAFDITLSVMQVPMTRIVEAVADGLNAARVDHAIRCNIIISGIRHISSEQSLRLAELAVAYKNKGVCGFDLAGAEYDYPAKRHREAFYLVRNNNVNSTCHAGEAYGPESIHQAIHYLGAHRIGHGTRLREDGDLLNYVTDHRIPLEICLTSNIQTRAVKDFKSHPLKFYYDFGARVTINTDNRLITDTTLTTELRRAVEHFDFDVYDVRQLAINGFKSAFMPFHERQSMLRRISAELDDLVSDEVAAAGKPVDPQGHGSGHRERAEKATAPAA